MTFEEGWLKEQISVTLKLPGTTQLPMVGGQWERKDNYFLARYTRSQLKQCLDLGAPDGTTTVRLPVR